MTDNVETTDGMASPSTWMMADVPHVYQSESWDCGLACAKMVLRCLKIPVEEASFDSACKKLCIKKSVWTIDLAHLMSYFGIKHKLFTITFGVDPTYKDVDFYNSDMFRFSEEEVRIKDLFDCAAEKGIIATKRSLDLREVVAQLQKGCLAIVLIDSSILQCHMCNKDLSQNFRDCFLLDDDSQSELSQSDSEGGTGYIGHFIVVCGYDLEKQFIFYKNPGLLSQLCRSSFDNFDAARKSHGTDEDILFIQR